jgi:hypothetical protein
MANYFNFFPKISYTLEDKKDVLTSVTNIIARFGFEESLKDNSAAFYKYDIKDSDTPETIAYKFYNNAEKHWVVLLFNNVIDPQWDWPLNDRRLTDYIDEKYSTAEYADTANTSVSGLSWAKNVSNVKSYYKVITTTTFEKTTIEKLEVDSVTYANNIIMENGTNQNYQLDDGSSINIKITKETKSYYQYEVELNEQRRSIKLLKPEFIPVIEKEFKRVIKQ